MIRSPSIAIDVRMHRNSGIGTYITHLVPLIIRARPDWQFFLLGPPAELAGYEWSTGDNVYVRQCTARIYSVTEQHQLRSRMPRDLDLFWAPHYNIPLVLPTKLLVTVHDLFHLAMPEYVGGLHRRIYARAMFAAVRHRANAILCDSQFTRNEFLRLVGEPRVAPRSIHLGVDESWFNIPEGQRPHDKPYFLFVGNVKPHKNLTTLLHAFRLVMNDIPHDLVIVGRREGFRTADPRVAIMASELGHRVYLTGPLAQPELQQYFAHAAALVFPSLYEGFGLPPLEAMAAGCPVIASSAASIPEVCGDAALYCDPYDPGDIARQLRRLLGERNSLTVLRQRGKQRAVTFDWNRCAAQTLAVIEELLVS